MLATFLKIFASVHLLSATSSSLPEQQSATRSACGYQHCLWANSSEDAGVGSLHQALKALSALGPGSSSAELRLTAGHFSLSDNHLLTFVNWRNLSLAGGGIGDTTLQCLDGVGIVFRNSSHVTLRNITISHCGRLLTTTSVSVTDLNTANASHSGTKFTSSKSGVHFDSCSNLTLSEVEVYDSTGMGVTIYNTGGGNRFLDSLFISNHLNAKDSHPGGGGVVIETSHCVPGDASCRDDQSKLVTRDASYVFQRCKFASNRATSHYLPFDSVYPHGRSHMGLGRGGGLFISLKGHAYRNRVVVNACTFRTNRAEWGGAMYLALGDTSVENSILVVNSSFSNNNFRDGSEADQTNTTVGGALRIQIVSYPPDQQLWPGYVSNVTGNSITVQNTQFWNNFGTWGGAVSFTTTRDVPGQTSPNSLHIKECIFGENYANAAASAIDITSWKPDIVDSLEPFMRPVIQDCTFNSNKMLFFNISDYPVGLGAVYVNSIPTNFVGENGFLCNEGTSLVVYGTYISVLESSRMNFTQNTGRRGGALAFIGNSWLIAHEGTSFLFDGNSVGTYGLGGAVYSVHFGGHDFVYEQNCFFRYHVYSVQPSLWNTTFVFRDNKADQKPNAIYMTCSQPCAWHVADKQNEKPGGGAFCENSTWIFEGSGRSCLNEVSTGPQKVIVAHYNIKAVPGWNTSLGVTTLNDFESPVPPVLTASPSQDSDRRSIAVASATEYISDDGIVIYGREKEHAGLLLMTLDPRVVASEVIISILPCPPGFTSVLCPEQAALTGMTCDCVCVMNVPGIQCDNETKEAYLLQLNCMSNSSSDSIVIARCPYNQDRRIKLNNLTAEQLEEKVCEPFNRQGFLCSKCKDGYGVAVNKYGYDCVECKGHQKYDWALFLLLELGPITLVCFLVILFGVSVAAPSMNAFVFFSQIVSVGYGVNVYTWFLGVDTISKKLSYPVFILYGVWNLEFFKDILPGICLHDGLKVLQILVINYVKALYPMILLGICYMCVQLYDRNFRILHILWKPFRYCQKVVYKHHQPKTSIVDAFATLIVLSYSKFMYVSFPLVTLISVHKLNGNSTGSTNSDFLRYHYYVDPNEVLHHSMANIVYFLLGVVVLVIFVGLPPIFLILYPLRFTQSCLGRLNVRIQISLRTFAEIFIGAFRDGTSGGHDCRWFAALYMIFRIILLIVSSTDIDNVASYLIRQILCTLGIFMFALVQPYKEQFYNHLDTSFFALLAILNSLSFYNSHLVALSDSIEKPVFYINYILIYLPLLYLVLMIVYNILTWRDCFACSKKSEESSDEDELSADGRSSPDEMSTTTEDHLPDRFIHPQDYTTTLVKSSSLGHPSSKGRGSRSRKGRGSMSRRRQPSADQLERPLLSDSQAAPYGSIQGYTV